MNKIVKNIINLIPPGSRVLDLGCGTGEFLQNLIKEKQVTGYGIDIEFSNIVKCINRNISVFQGDIEEGLSELPDQSYDYVILSQTLQEIQNPLNVISHMLRVGGKGIITFPNFAYWKARLQFLHGIPPKTKTLPYDWYNTPNIRVVSIESFRQLCKEHQFHIHKEIPVYDSPLFNFISPRILSNAFSKRGMFVLEKKK